MSEQQVTDVDVAEAQGPTTNGRTSRAGSPSAAGGPGNQMREKWRSYVRQFQVARQKRGQSQQAGRNGARRKSGSDKAPGGLRKALTCMSEMTKHAAPRLSRCLRAFFFHGSPVSKRRCDPAYQTGFSGRLSNGLFGHAHQTVFLVTLNKPVFRRPLSNGFFRDAYQTVFLERSSNGFFWNAHQTVFFGIRLSNGFQDNSTSAGATTNASCPSGGLASLIFVTRQP